MIVIVVAFAPVLLLAVVDDTANNLTLVTAAATSPGIREVQDAALQVIVGFRVSKDLAVVLLQVTQAVVPVDGHGKGITHKEAK